MITVFVSHNKGEEAIHHNYNIESSDDTHAIYDQSGDILASLDDDGDGYEITCGEETIHFNYFEAEFIIALLTSVYDGKMKLYETKEIRNI